MEVTLAKRVVHFHFYVHLLKFIIDFYLLTITRLYLPDASSPYHNRHCHNSENGLHG